MSEEDTQDKPSEKEVLKSIYSISETLQRDRTLEEVLEFVCQTCSDLIFASSCSVMLLDRKNRLLSAASAGLNQLEHENISFKLGEGVAGGVAKSGEPALINDVQSDPRFKEFPDQEISISSLMVVPLLIRGRIIGTISCTAEKSNYFDKEDLELIQFVANSIVKDIENIRLYKIATTDTLTGAHNRSFLNECINNQLGKVAEKKNNFSILLLDLDHFKKINDNFGHQAGDQVLRGFCQIIIKEKRTMDILIRYGGEEFLLVMPETDKNGAMIFATRIQKIISEENFNFGGQKIKVTVSGGIAEYSQESNDFETLFEHADKNLYKAKEKGRNLIL